MQGGYLRTSSEVRSGSVPMSAVRPKPALSYARLHVYTSTNTDTRPTVPPRAQLDAGGGRPGANESRRCRGARAMHDRTLGDTS